MELISASDRGGGRPSFIGPVAHRVCRGDPTHEPTQFAVGVRPQDKLPMIEHPLDTEELDIVRILPSREDSLKRGIIFRLVKISSRP